MDKMRLVQTLWNYMKMNQELKKSDCILGCGCHDVNVAVKCIELFLEGYGDIILFSGGFGKITENLWKEPEAKRFMIKAIEMGVPKEKIVIEDKSTNTGDNFRFTQRLIQEKNLTLNLL